MYFFKLTIIMRCRVFSLSENKIKYRFFYFKEEELARNYTQPRNKKP